MTTAANVPVSGGKLRLYIANTTTLADIFTDAGLSIPAANPLVAGSDGVLPQFFASEGLVVDGDFLTAANVIITGQSFVDAVFVGANTGTITRDFGTGGRLRIAGSAGVVSIEAGDPIGDDVGGKMRLGGYNGTQADTISLDGAAVNVTGRLTEQGKKMLGVVQTTATVFTNVAQVDIAIPNSPTGTREYEIELFDLYRGGSGAAGNLQLRFSYDGGATYKSGASDYGSRTMSTTNGNTASGAGFSFVTLSVGSGTPANIPGRSRIKITCPNSGSDSTQVWGETIFTDGTGADLHVAGGFGKGGYGRPTNVRIYHSIENITGAYLVKTMRGYGE